MRELWREEDPGNRVTAGQRMADALEQLLTGPRKGKGDGRVQDVKLLLIADYDTLNNQVRRMVAFGGWDPSPPGRAAPVGLRRAGAARHLRRPITTVGPGLGPADRQRRPTSRPDRPRPPLCGMRRQAAWCQAHHIVHWADGGPTSVDNMVLLCSKCHHKVHDNDWQIRQTPTGQYTLETTPHHPQTQNPPNSSHPPPPPTHHQTKKMSITEGNPSLPNSGHAAPPHPLTRHNRHTNPQERAKRVNKHQPGQTRPPTFATFPQQNAPLIGFPLPTRRLLTVEKALDRRVPVRTEDASAVGYVDVLASRRISQPNGTRLPRNRAI